MKQPSDMGWIPTRSQWFAAQSTTTELGPALASFIGSAPYQFRCSCLTELKLVRQNLVEVVFDTEHHLKFINSDVTNVPWVAQGYHSLRNPFPATRQCTVNVDERNGQRH